MDSAYETAYHELEEQHWWFRARRDAVFALIQNMHLPKDAAILEVGCSGGPLQQRLRAEGYSNLTGIDLSEPAIALARQRQIPNVQQMDGARLSFADASFDVVVASDVLEHIEDEQRALLEWRRVLRPGGRLLVFVPAFQLLWSEHDVVNHHFRRYSGPQLRVALTRANLTVERLSYWNSALFAPAAAVRLLQRLRPTPKSLPSGDLKLLPGALNGALLTLLRLENRLLRHVNLPVGISTFALARKPV
ncbi:Methyltransferase domain-containing protein [Hymenobacter daecheongensis DSM 21074]|uniref:Methyltransferase domain-containing protein n=1 Tax=Hymenobacter daecheongensis DSM 21074 TaxID=1121955 RepID=A0A1M6IM42_9BACT|nr:class I SAM-dependent methyltransferase [Hymenobacter daecheongensis]SHJ35541.1 Methyltransferase domain-containing protein [Hymenobacter daecheongensis DSM 21074]